jgi:hypothetical protein
MADGWKVKFTFLFYGDNSWTVALIQMKFCAVKDHGYTYKIYLNHYLLWRSLSTSFHVRDQVSHPYRTTGRIMVLYISTCKVLDSRREDRRLNHVKWVACHHGMARPLDPDGGDGLHTWRVGANILNKLSRTADRGWPSSFGVGRGG